MLIIAKSLLLKDRLDWDRPHLGCFGRNSYRSNWRD